MNRDEKSENFDPAGLNAIRYGRPDKKKSLKVKRSLFSLALISYLYWGIVILLAKAFVRFKNNRVQLSSKEILKTLILWPKIIYEVYLRGTAIYYR